VAFHTAVVHASHNPLLIELHQAMATTTRSGMHDTETDPDLPDPGTRDHADLIRAIGNRAPERPRRPRPDTSAI
jgi:DNA-binding FadR family transcriptional regulator